jgi:hypothetical protein
MRPELTLGCSAKEKEGISLNGRIKIQWFLKLL